MRAELKDLASDSLDLLKTAFFDERFPALFDLDVYGSIVGMFELNNLGVYPLALLEDHQHRQHPLGCQLLKSVFAFIIAGVCLDQQQHVVQGYAE